MINTKLLQSIREDFNRIPPTETEIKLAAMLIERPRLIEDHKVHSFSLA